MFPSSKQDRNTCQVILPLVVGKEEVLNGFNFIFNPLFPLIKDNLQQFLCWENNLPTVNRIYFDFR